MHPSLPALRRLNVPRASGRSMEASAGVATSEADTPTFWAQERRRSARQMPIPYLVEAVAHKSQVQSWMQTQGLQFLPADVLLSLARDQLATGAEIRTLVCPNCHSMG